MKLLVFAFVFMLLLSVVTVSAFSVSDTTVEFVGDSFCEHCITYLVGDTVSTCPFTTNVVGVKITNNDDQSHIYDLSLELPEGWKNPENAFIDQDVSLGSGETGLVKLYIVPPNVPPEKTYEIKVKVSSEGVTVTKTLEVNLLACHYAEITMEEFRETCSGQAVNYTVKVKNIGKDDDDFEVKITPSWSQESLLEASMHVVAQQTETFDITVVPPEEPGVYKITVNVISKYYKNFLGEDLSVKKTVQLTVMDCYNFEVDLQPKEALTCLGKSSKYVLYLTNKGLKKDTYKITTTPEWVMSGKNSITLEPNKEGTVSIIVIPKLEGKATFNVTVTPEGRVSLKKAITGMIEGSECKGAAVVVSPAEKTVCLGEKVEYEIIVKNTGAVQGSYDLTTTYGELSENKVLLNPGEISKVKLTVDTGQLRLGENNITVSVITGEVSDQNTVTINIESCYLAELKVTPKKYTICKGDPINYTIDVENTGRYPGNYTLEIDGNEISGFYLEPGDSKRIPTTLVLDYKENESHSITFALISDYFTTVELSELTVKPKSYCYCIELSSEKVSELKKAMVGEGSVIKVNAKNCGTRADCYKVKIDGPEWVVCPTVDNICLGLGEAEDFYLYVSPPLETELGNYSTGLIVGSPNAENRLNFVIGVVPAVNVTVPPEGPKINITLPTGLFISLSDFFKDLSVRAILLGIIVILIIIILVVKFVFFIK